MKLLPKIIILKRRTIIRECTTESTDLGGWVFAADCTYYPSRPRRYQPADQTFSGEDDFDIEDELSTSSLAKRRCTDKVCESQTSERTQDRMLNPTLKTAVTVLQEMMVKNGQIPEYECISQSGPQHAAMFEYRCRALGCEVTAAARSKKEAKQEAARRMLLDLATHGQQVPPPYGISRRSPETKPVQLGSNSYVALLNDLCSQYRLPTVEYQLIGDTGPAHLRQFTIKAWIGQHERVAVATTKKCARQLAAEQLYKYMRENLSRLTTDFNEEEAMVRAHERAMERYIEMKDEVIWRPNLGQRVADYHNGLRDNIDESKREAAKKAIEESEAENSDIVSVVEAAAKALELTISASILPAEGGEIHLLDQNSAIVSVVLTISASTLPAEGGEIHLLELGPTSPALAFAGIDHRAAAAAVLRYLKMSL